MTKVQKIKESMVSALLSNTSYDVAVQEGSKSVVAKDYTSARYNFHLSILRQDNINLSASANKLDSSYYLSKGNTSKHRIIHSGISTLVSDYNSNEVFGNGLKSDMEEVEEYLNANKNTFEICERIISSLGYCYVRLTWVDRVVSLDVYYPHQVEQKGNSYLIRQSISKTEYLVEEHSIGEVRFYKEKNNKLIALTENERALYGVYDYQTGLETQTILRFDNFRKDGITGAPIGDLWYSEGLVDEVYNILGKENRALELSQTKYIVNELMLSKGSSGRQYFDNNQDVYSLGAMSDDVKPVQELLFDSKSEEFCSKYSEALSRVLSSAGYNAVSFGLSKDDYSSGVALSIREKRTISTINNKKQSWLINLNSLMNLVVAIWNEPNVEFTIGIPSEAIDPSQLFNNLKELYQMGVLTTEQFTDQIVKMGYLSIEE